MFEPATQNTICQMQYFLNAVSKKGPKLRQSLSLGFCKFGDSGKTNDIVFIYFNMAIVSLIQILLHLHISVLHLDLITCLFYEINSYKSKQYNFVYVFLQCEV